MKRHRFVLGTALAVLLSVTSSVARNPVNTGLRFMERPTKESLPPELRESIVSPNLSSAAADTFHLAWYSFDNGGNPDTQGWVSYDLPSQLDTFFHVESATVLDGGQFGRLIVLEGNQSMWCGQAVSAVPPFCGYATLPGYGNRWYQTLYSKVFDCDSLALYFEIIWDSEPGYDETSVEYYEGISNTWIKLGVSSAGGSYYDGSGQAIEGLMFPATAGSTQVRFVFFSDGAWSDEDGLWNTDGAVIVDSITVECFNNSVLTDSYYEDFEGEAVGAHATDDGCWVAGFPLPFGDFSTLYPGATILQEDPCLRNLTSLWGFFDDPNITNYTCHTPDPQPSQGAIRYGPDERGLYINNEIWSPWIPNAGSGSKYTLKFDVYRDLARDSGIRYKWAVRSVVSGCPGQWRNTNLVYNGGGRDWFRHIEQVGSLIDPGAEYIQIAVGVVDMCPFWCNIFLTGACHGHGPLFDNVHLERIDVTGPEFSVRHLDLFQDTFAEDGTLTGTARADAANDIRFSSDPQILPGDSITITVSDQASGVATDPHTGSGSAVYTYVAVWPQGQPGKSGPELESPHLRVPPQGSALGKRYPLVDSLVHDGVTWYCFRMDTAFTIGGSVVNNGSTRCFDLNDTVLTPGDTICYVFCAENAIGEKTYWSRRVNGQGVDFTTTDLWEALNSPCEFMILPSGGSAHVGDFLYVDDADDRGGPPQLHFDWDFDWLGILGKVDRYDVLSPSSSVGNSLASRVKNIATQIIGPYKNIIWNTGNLSSGLIGDGGSPNGGSSSEKSNDWALLFQFLDQRTNYPGLYLSGDDLAADWISLTGASAIATRTTYMDFALAGSSPGNHVQSGEHVSPCLVAVGPSFIHLGVPDSLIAFGGCPLINDFDLLTPLQGQAEFVSADGGLPYIISQTTVNAVGDTARVFLSGLSHHTVHSKRPGFPYARMELLRDIIRALRNELSIPTAVQDPPVVGRNVLKANYPNPFNPTTTIRYNVREPSHVTLRIYNVAGQLVRTLVDDVKAPAPGGLHTVVWHGDSQTGQEVASGVYFYKLVTSEFTKTRKMVLLK